MNLTEEELKNYRPLNGMVLIKPNPGHNKIKVGEIELSLDISFEKEKHTPSVGRVIQIPSDLRCRETMEWETEIEIIPGDEVWYSYLAALQALDLDLECFVMVGREPYFLIPYSECFVAKRHIEFAISDEAKEEPKFKIPDWNGGDFKNTYIIPLNGYVLASQIKEVKAESEVLDIKETAVSTRYAKIEHIGSRNTWYRNEVYKDFEDILEVGQTIAFKPTSNLPLQYDFHNSLEGRKEFYRIQRKDIGAII